MVPFLCFNQKVCKCYLICWISIVFSSHYTDIDWDCQESWSDFISPKSTVLRENIVMREYINLLVPPKCDVLSIPVNTMLYYIRWSKWMVSSKCDGALWVPQGLVTRLGACLQNKLNANMTSQFCPLSIMAFYRVLRTLIMECISFCVSFLKRKLML